MLVKVLTDAYEDVLDGRNFYDAQELGLGAYFSRTIFSDIRSLSNFAGIHPKRHGYYMMLIRRFPYAVYYDIVEEEVQVIAVLDCRRDPDWIQRRLSQQ